ncbi:MAG: sulfatase-like hydrolase/transferase [Candidatus Hydrogenedentota bacterium]
MKRRTFLQCTAAGAAAWAMGAHALTDKNGRPPNVLLIMADDLGYECLGAYGGTSYNTPNLDHLAATGMRFDHCYSTPKCVPSRVNILTGRYGFRTGQEWGYIPPDEVTFADVLKKAGYATAVAGKWQLALLEDNPDHPREKGFDEWSLWAWHEGPRYWNPMIWQNGAIRDDVADRYGPEVYTEFLIDFMRRHRDQPFLAYYPMCLPHFAKTGGDYKEPTGPDGAYQDFDTLVHQTDAMVGRLVAALDRLGLRENTLILFTGDNGTSGKVTSEVNGRTMQGGKGEHTDAGTHVPLIVNQPGAVPAGTTCADLVDFSDFMPTFADLAGADLPADRTIDGESFFPQVQGKEGDPRDWVYTEWQGKAWIRNHRWKLYDNGDLYDMAADPEEKDPIRPGKGDDEAQHARAHLAEALADLRAEES